MLSFFPELVIIYIYFVCACLGKHVTSKSAEIVVPRCFPLFSSFCS